MSCAKAAPQNDNWGLKRETRTRAGSGNSHSKTQRRGKHSLVNNGETRDLKRNEPLRDCDLSLNLGVSAVQRAVFST